MSSFATYFTCQCKLWLSESWVKLKRSKKITGMGDMLETQLKRCLSTLDITLLGIGHMVGFGVYVLTSPLAKNVVGPAIVLAYIISGFASLLAALCYAEFSVRFPRAGSAYSYTYLALGEFWAFNVGWNMIMENLIGIAVVSKVCSSYLDSLTNGAIRNTSISLLSFTGSSIIESMDIFAFLIIILFLILLTCGVRVTSYLNNIFSLINICVILIIITVGIYYSDITNWNLPSKGFMPFGWKGVFSASASCFYAFIGFDSIATSGEEAKDPQRSIPLATILSMSIASIAYVGVATVLTLMIPYYDIHDESGLPDALGKVGAEWAKILVILGALCGMITVLIGTMYSLTRIVYAMANDGLIFNWMSKVNESTQIPLYAMYFFTSIGSLLALFLDLNTLLEMVSIGTLLAYLVVAASVIIVRYEPIDYLHENFSEVDDHQELNELSADTCPQNDNNLIYNSRDSSGYIDGLTMDCCNPTIRAYFSKLRLLKYAPKSMPTICVFVMVIVIFMLCALGPVLIKASEENWIYTLIIAVMATILAFSFAIIALHHQFTYNLRYKVPCVPFIPTLTIVFNATLMTNLQALTWLRLITWMTIGMVIYFTYGINHSRLNPESAKVNKDVKKWGSLDHCFTDSAENGSILSSY